MTSTTKKQIPIVCPGHTRPLTELQFCQVGEDETLLVTACHDRLPMLRHGVSGDWIGTFAGHKGAVWSCQLDATANLAATASGDFSLRVWDAITGQSLWEWKHKHILKSVSFSPSSKFLISGGQEGLLRIYDLQKAAQNPSNLPEPVVLQQTDASSNKLIPITKCLWLDDAHILTGGADGILRVWTTQATGAPIRTISTDVKAEIRDMELSRDMLIVAVGKKVQLFQVDLARDAIAITRQSSFDMPIHFQAEGGASIHPSHTKFVAGGSDLWVRVFDAKTGQELECHKGHHGPIRCLRYNPTGDLYASGSEDGTIRLWKTNPEAE